MEIDLVQILGAVLPSLSSALAAFFFSKVKLYKAELSKREEATQKRDMALEGGVRSLLRCRLLISYARAMKENFLPKEEIGVIQEMFNEYCTLNGDEKELAPLIDEMMKLPHYKNSRGEVSSVPTV